jgi:hypothetical protein
MKFIPQETYTNEYMIGIDESPFREDKDYCYTSSYWVLQARLLGLTYPDYLRYLRSKGAKLKGKCGYSSATFVEKSSALEICKILNKEWDKMEDFFRLNS